MLYDPTKRGKCKKRAVRKLKRALDWGGKKKGQTKEGKFAASKGGRTTFKDKKRKEGDCTSTRRMKEIP